MIVSSISEIKKELTTLDPDTLFKLCMRLAKYKKENKELLAYLLFESHNEEAYIENIKEELSEMFDDLPTGTYLIKKSLRKILRTANKRIKYSGIKQTELEVRIFFCTKMKDAHIARPYGSVLFNLYQQQIKKVYAILEKLHEDLQGNYTREIKYITS
jgi:hypothetical protein